MPRFSVAFSKRKSAGDALENPPMTSPETPSFRVIERNEIEKGRAFDGGAKLARSSRSFPPKTNLVDLGAEDNMFADLKINRGSNISSTTKGTSTDNSSRHSNASTAPSSADMGGPGGPDDGRAPPKSAPHETPGRTGSRSIGSGLLDRATRTFSFGGQKKHTIPPPKQEPIPDVPPMIGIGSQEPGPGIPRSLTASTASPSLSGKSEEGSGGFDLGGDFGSMFKNFEKRASTATLTLASHDSAAPRSLTGNRYGSPGGLSPDMTTPNEPLLSQLHSPTGSNSDTATSPTLNNDAPPPVPRHEHLNSFKYSSRPDDIMEDEDAKLLRESFTAMKFLSRDHDEGSNMRSPQSRYGDNGSRASNTVASSFQREENMFEGSPSRATRPSQRYSPTTSNQSRNKVMTPAEFERYRQDKEDLSTAKRVSALIKPTEKEDEDQDDDEDEINYDDDDDEHEKSKQQARQRRKQEAHMAVYRQQMMKVTGENSSPPLPIRQPAGRPVLVSSSSAPAVHLKGPSPEPGATGASSDDDDEDVPLAILQAHGFPHKQRPPTHLSTAASNPNLRASMLGQAPNARPPSAMGDSASISGRRHSTLPAFARNLPQDPFVGASIARPAIRESLLFGDAGQPTPPPQPQGPPPGGLVGVIASEERSRAMRRGSPNIDTNKLIGGAANANLTQGYDPYAAIPPHMMYNGAGMQGMPQMHQMQPPSLSIGDQAQIQMTQQMQQFMQMQMQFMQMMAGNQNNGPQMQQPPMPPYGGGAIPGNQSMADLTARQSMMMGDSMMDPRLTDPGMRTMSMVQPSSASFMAPRQQGPPSIRGPIGGNVAYTPSIAPSERSNVGLPGRYRAVSQAAASTPLPGYHMRSNTMSGGLSDWSDDKSKSTVKLMSKSRDASDDEDDEQGWEAMKNKRDKKRSIWKSKRTQSELNVGF